jgi:hypothetical protein
MKKGDKEKKSATAGEKADNASVHSQPTVQKKTEQGETETYNSGHEDHNQLPPKKPGEKTTTGVDKV